MIDHGRAPIPLHTPVRFIPRWGLRRFLKPMNDRSLIAPLAQTMHSSLVYSREHERPHGVLVLPNGSRPESIPSIARRIATARQPNSDFACQAERSDWTTH